MSQLRLPDHGGAVAVRAFLLKYWDRLRSGFWFVPGVMTGAAILLAMASVALDESATVADWMVEQNWAYTGGAEGASLVLSTIAGSMITIAGALLSPPVVTDALA